MLHTYLIQVELIISSDYHESGFHVVVSRVDPGFLGGGSKV